MERKSNRKKYIIGLVLILVVLLVGSFFIYSYMANRNKNDAKNNVAQTETDTPAYSPEAEIPQETDDPEVIDSQSKSNGDTSQQIDNSDLAQSIEPTEEMKKLISDNRNDLNDSSVIEQITETYPSNVIPLYKAKSAADSNEIITQNGKPGWTAQYGSDATVPELADFYNNLLSSSSGYKLEENGDSRTITGIVDNCQVAINVTPNNPERTGLNDQSNVDIYIERN